MKTIEHLDALAPMLATAELPKAKECWRGADVSITPSRDPEPTRNSFYPPDRHVGTVHALELSWMFMSLRDAFYAESRINGCSKIEFFGRLANAAARCLDEQPNVPAPVLCAATLHEAYAIFDEMELGEFRCLAFAMGNTIVDDGADQPRTAGFTDVWSTLAFFSARGVHVSRE